MTIVTSKVSGRRELRFHALDEIVADAEMLAAAREVRMLGNWSMAQIFQHLARSQNMSLDGSDYRPPIWMRWIGPLMKKRMLTKGMPAGFKLPEGIRALQPAEDVSTEDALAALKSSVERLRNEQPTQPHPGFGQLDDDEWLQLHLRHAELHLSFAVPVA